MSFPTHRMRRSRRTETLRRMLRENTFDADDLIYPLFVVHGNNVKTELKSMPGIFHLSIDKLVEETREIFDLGIPAILLFGLPAQKDDQASEAYAPDGIVQRGIRAIKTAVPDLIVITDVCLCEYMTHCHCGIVENGYVLNDPTLELLSKTALSHARAGADIVAPASMMDGMIQALRKTLDVNGFINTLIMSYASKYASNLYNPFFKEGTKSVVAFGDKRTHQMDYSNGDEALREVALDIEEGADIVIVKPGMMYLDIVYRVKQKFGMPVAVYNVSGEYAMIKAAGAAGSVNEKQVMLEVLTGFKRAGADLIITYFAKEAARLLQKSTT
ncbi:MAG: porphobilinogen synthase [Candidatus Brocadiaceae bacterium]